MFGMGLHTKLSDILNNSYIVVASHLYFFLVGVIFSSSRLSHANIVGGGGCSPHAEMGIYIVVVVVVTTPHPLMHIPSICIAVWGAK